MHLICAIGVLLNCTSQFNLLMLQSKFSTSGFMKERKKKRGKLYTGRKELTNIKTEKGELLASFLVAQMNSSRLQPLPLSDHRSFTEGVLQVLLSHQFEVFLYGLCR